MFRTMIVMAVMLLVGALNFAPTLSSEAGAAQMPKKRDDKSVPAKEVWYRIHLSELERGGWRSVGTYENPSRDNCLSYGRGWVDGGRPGTRKFTGPFEFINKK